MGFRQRTAEHGEILAEDIDLAAVDGAPAGNDAVARHLLLRHAEIGGAVGDVHVVFFEGAFIEQHVDALARRQLALAMLGIDALLAAAEPGLARRASSCSSTARISSCPCEKAMSRRRGRRSRQARPS
jgi:hypothetical protein